MTRSVAQYAAPERPLILLGAGGHARVLLALAKAARYCVLGVCDPGLATSSKQHWEGLKVLGDDKVLEKYSPDAIQLMLGVGQLTTGTLKERLYDTWSSRGYSFPALVHPSAWIAPDVRLGAGVQVMAGVIIQPGCSVGENSILNTRSSIDHDCQIGSRVHVAPGATLCGTVSVGLGAFVGAGSVVIQGLQIGERAIVGAGVTLVRDLAPSQTIVGSANRMRQ